MTERTEAPASTCVACDRAVPRVHRPAGPSVGFCAPGAAELGLVPMEDLSELSLAEVDRLPFGYIALDLAGLVLRFNAWEARLSGLDPGSVVGRSFFREVAPCTSVRAFAGRYERMVRGEHPRWRGSSTCSASAGASAWCRSSSPTSPGRPRGWSSCAS